MKRIRNITTGEIAYLDSDVIVVPDGWIEDPYTVRTNAEAYPYSWLWLVLLIALLYKIGGVK